ncbi:acyltransferase family protein [Puia dinghuensis]|uniref:Acyltransferase n=1 Tax=Puia dinghuensis TaxID=1792502 RepID=A0A8J2UEY4_9BACT|nr:acyltransferase [Puia dinghuensis]GGB08258.1 acyltransferase [Puia dinghuensis]
MHHFRKIDFLRGIAILTVFQAHFLWYYFPAYGGMVVADSGHPAARVFLLNFLPRSIGWGGVTIFILVSGFLLHLGYLKDRQFTLRGFYSRRFWRVYPPYLLVLIAFSLFLEKGLFSSRDGWLTFLLHALSLQNLFTRTYFSVNPTFWCLAAEVQLYLLYALFLYGRKRWGVKPMVGFTFLLSVAWQTVGMHVSSLAGALPWANAPVSLWFIWATGALLGEAYFEGKSLWSFLSRRDRLFALGGLVVAVCVAPIYALGQYAVAIIGVFFMDWFLHAKRITLQNWPARVVITIGLCSFSIFLVHQPLIHVFIGLFNKSPLHYPGYRVVSGILATLAIFLLSYAMYHWVELPSIRIGNRLRQNNPSTRK